MFFTLSFLNSISHYNILYLAMCDCISMGVL